jgi:hypothetical protein
MPTKLPVKYHAAPPTKFDNRAQVQAKQSGNTSARQVILPPPTRFSSSAAPAQLKAVLPVIQMMWGKGPPAAVYQAPTKPVQQPPAPKAKAKAQPKPQIQYKYVLTYSARKHYNDGWGAQYNIRDDGALIGYVKHNDQGDNYTFEEPAEVYMGPYEVKQKEKDCYILYHNNWIDNVTCEYVIFHCGPGKPQQ